MDRLADLLVLSGIAIHMAANADAWGVALVCWVIIGSVMTSYTRARAEKHLARFTLGFLERAERCLILIVGALSGYLGLALWVVAIGATATAIQRLVAARHLLMELDRTGTDPTCGSERALEV